VLPSASTLSIVRWREYSLTVGASKKQLPSRNEVSEALNGWTLTNILAIISVIDYYVDQNWALREVQCQFEVVDSLFFSYFKC